MYTKPILRTKLTVVLIAAGLLFYGGCADESVKTGKFTEEEMASIPLAQRKHLPVVSNGLTLSIDTETITVGEVLNPETLQLLKPFDGSDYDGYALLAKPAIKRDVVERIAGILLYKEARKQASDSIDEMLDKAVEKEVNKFQALHGNNLAEAQKALENQGMDWQQFREHQKKVLLTQSYYAANNVWEEEPITHSEMLDYYKAMQNDNFEFKGIIKKEDVKWAGMIHFSLIDVDADKLTADDINTDGFETPKEAALRKTRKLIVDIKNGADFAELAKQLSHGHRAAMGGLWTPVAEGSQLIPRYAVIQTEAEKMRIGDIAGPIEYQQHVYLIKLEDKKVGGKASFAELQKRIEYEIRRMRRNERINKLVSKLMAQADIPNLDPFVDVCTQTAWRRWQTGDVEG